MPKTFYPYKIHIGYSINIKLEIKVYVMYQQNSFKLIHFINQIKCSLNIMFCCVDGYKLWLWQPIRIFCTNIACFRMSLMTIRSHGEFVNFVIVCFWFYPLCWEWSCLFGSFYLFYFLLLSFILFYFVLFYFSFLFLVRPLLFGFILF